MVDDEVVVVPGVSVGEGLVTDLSREGEGGGGSLVGEDVMAGVSPAVGCAAVAVGVGSGPIGAGVRSAVAGKTRLWKLVIK